MRRTNAIDRRGAKVLTTPEIEVGKYGPDGEVDKNGSANFSKVGNPFVVKLESGCGDNFFKKKSLHIMRNERGLWFLDPVTYKNNF
jgi:hypothetical protein